MTTDNWEMPDKSGRTHCDCQGPIVPRDIYSNLLQNRRLHPWAPRSPFCPLSAMISVSDWLSMYLVILRRFYSGLTSTYCPMRCPEGKRCRLLCDMHMHNHQPARLPQFGLTRRAPAWASENKLLLSARHDLADDGSAAPVAGRVC